MNDYIDTILDDNEKSALIAFNQTSTMKQAVKKVLLQSMYRNGKLRQGEPPDALRNAAFSLVSSAKGYSNAEIGEDLRGLWQGINGIEWGFDQIEQFLPEGKVAEKKNEAR